METFEQDFVPTSKKIESDPELENFLGRVDEVSDIIRGLISVNPSDQQKALRKADILIRDDSPDINEDTVQYKVKSNKTVINKAMHDSSEGKMEQQAFMRMVEKDANDRTKDRKERKEKSDGLRKIGNMAFSKQNYAEALSCYNKAISLIKDSPCLYNNRAVTYIRIGIFAKAIEDCDKAIELAEYSMKARLLKAKAYFLKCEPEKSKECLREAEKIHPSHIKMIKTFEKDLFDMKETSPNDKQEEDDLLAPEKLWRKASKHQLVDEKDTKKSTR